MGDSWNDFVGLFDPFHIVSSKPKAKQTEYMKRQGEVIKRYRHWYYKALDEGVLTVTQMKKKGLYSEHALDEGVSTMGGGGGGGGGFGEVGANPGITQNPHRVVLPADEVDSISDSSDEIQDLVEGVKPAKELKKNRSARLSRERRRAKVSQRRELARKLQLLTDPDDPSKQVEYNKMTIRELEREIGMMDQDAQEQQIAMEMMREEKGEPFSDERKHERPDGSSSSGAGTSSRELEDLERKMLDEERMYTRNPEQGYQAIKTGRNNPPGAVTWSALRSLIVSSITNESLPQYGTLLVFTGDRTSARTATLGTTLTQIADMSGSQQRILDLLSQFGLDIRDAGGNPQSPENVSRMGNQFSKLSAGEKRQLLVAFNKLFRNLMEERIEQMSNDPRLNNSKVKQDNLRKMKTLLGDLATKITPSQMAGSEVAPDKPMNTGDFLDAENQQMITIFTQLLATTGASDAQVSATLDQLSLRSEQYTRVESRAAEGRGEDINDHDVQVQIQANVYAQLVGDILQHISGLKNMLESRFVKESSLRNEQNIFKLKRTLTQLIDEVKQGVAQAAKLRVIPTTLTALKRRVLDLKRLLDSIKTPNTGTQERIQFSGSDNLDIWGGTEMTPLRSEFSSADVRQFETDREQDEWMDERYPESSGVEEKLNVHITPDDKRRSRRMLEELKRAGQDDVTVTLLGNDITVGTNRVPIHWGQLPVASVRQILLDYINDPRRGPMTEDGRYLLAQQQWQIRVANQEELYRMADHIIKDRTDRINLLNAYPAAKPRRGQGDPPEDPNDPPGGGINVTINGRRYLMKVAGITSLLILLGVGTAKIVDMVNKGGTVTKPNPAPIKPPSGDGDIGNGGDNNDDGNNNDPIITPGKMRPTFPRPNSDRYPVNPDNRGGNTDPIYGGIGVIYPRARGFLPIKQPMLDSVLGADYLEPDANMMNNSAIMKLVQRYNDDAQRFNDLIEIKYDLDEAGGGEKLSAEELQDMENLSASMKNQVVAINQQSGISGGGGGGDFYKTEPIAPTLIPNTLRTLDGRSINKVYPLIPRDPYTQSLGLDDDIEKYNSLVEEYNVLSARWKTHGTDYNIVGDSAAARESYEKYVTGKTESPEYAIAVARATVLEGEIEPLLTKINSVMASPESGIGRTQARGVSYSPLQKSFIQKMTASQFDSITAEEKKAMRDSPELYASYEQLMTWYAKSKTVPFAKRDFATHDRLMKEFIAIKDRGMTMSSEKDPAQATDWTRVQKESQTEYVRSKQDFLSAVAALKQAKMSGATPHAQSQLYNDLETKRLHYERSRTSYETMADNYKHALSGRTSFLADMTLERLPDGVDEAAEFDRLQEVERVLQHNPDALKAYNDGVTLMNTGGFGTTNTQNYAERMDLLKSISGKYNLSGEYEDAVNRNIHVQVQDAGEDPSTVVEFKEGSEDVGKSTERANFIDPAERELFMTDKRDRLLEQKRWEEFSLVQPWNGLGTPRTNPLLDHQVQEYMTRYGNTTKGYMPTPNDMRNLQSNRCRMIQAREQQPNYQADIAFIPTIQASYGREVWENEFAIPTTNFQTQEAMFTRNDNNLPNNRWSTYYPQQGNTYHPDIMIDRHNFDPSVGPTLKQNSNRRSVYYGVTPAFNEQYGSQQTSTFGGATMNNNYGPHPNLVNGQPIQQPQKKPNSIYDTLDSSSRRGMGVRRR
jgi:hypothetical protein